MTGRDLIIAFLSLILLAPIANTTTKTTGKLSGIPPTRADKVKLIISSRGSPRNQNPITNRIAAELKAKIANCRAKVAV